MVIQTFLKKAPFQPRRVLLSGKTRDKGVQTDPLIFVAPPQIVPVAYNETQMILHNTGRILALLEVGQTGKDDSVIGVLKDPRRRLQSDGVIMAKLDHIVRQMEIGYRRESSALGNIAKAVQKIHNFLQDGAGAVR